MDQPTNLTAILAEASPPTEAEQVPPEMLAEDSTLDRIKAADAARPGFPGEHWLVLAMGIAMWQLTRRHRYWAVRAAGGLAASALVARAAAGRQGLSKVLRYTPFGRGISNCPPCEGQATQKPQREAYPFPTTRTMTSR